jgi:hypothetical protein
VQRIVINLTDDDVTPAEITELVRQVSDLVGRTGRAFELSLPDESAMNTIRRFVGGGPAA